MKKKELLILLCSMAVLCTPMGLTAQQRGSSPFKREEGVQIPKSYTAPLIGNEVQASPILRSSNSVPWSVAFTDKATFETFTVINANNDDGTWGFYKMPGRDPAAAYSYSSRNDADDWFISPKVTLQAGVNYDIKFHALSDSKSYIEKFEVKVGKEATLTGMKEGVLILPVTELQDRKKVSFVQQFTPTESGAYCIGFHALSAANQNRLLLYDVSVEEGAVAAAPKKPENLTITPDAGGDLKAKISFTAPSKTVNEAPLSSIDSIVIRRNTEIIKVLKNVTPGSPVAYNDEQVSLNGINHYSVAAYKGADKSTDAEKDVFIGVDLPVAPASFTITDNQSYIGATWEKVTKGVNDGRFNPDKLTYKIYAFDKNNNPTIEVKDVVATTTTQIEFNTTEGPQHLQQYAVAAVNTAGKGRSHYSNALIVGKADEIPFRESFSDGLSQKFEHFWWMDGEGKGYENGMSVATFDKLSADGDGSCIKLTTLGYNDKLNLNTGKINLVKSDNLKFAFSYKTDGAPNAQLNLMVIMPGGNAMKLQTFDIRKKSDWKTTSINVPDYLSNIKGVMFRFQLEATGAPSIPQVVYIDNVNIAAAKNIDIAAGLILPEKVQKGRRASIKVKVKNYGSSDVTAYKVTVKADDETVFEETISETLPAFGYKEVPVVFITHAIATGEYLKVTAEASVDGDEDTTNNTAEGDIKLYEYVGNTVEDLKAETTSEGVKLTWKAPIPKIENIKEDFEQYEPWLIDNIGDWKVVDRDQNIVGGIFSDLALPHEHERYAFMVINFEPDYHGGSYFPGNSGYSYLGSFYCINEDGTSHLPNDNWLISPDLSGNAQTISFYAINHDGPQDAFPENVNVLYSKTDKEPDSFIQIGRTHVISGNKWQKISVDLPQGALYFAIQSKNEGGKSNWLGIDDISFEKGTGDVKSYNIYRDSKKLSTVSEGTEFVDKAPLKGTHTYQVTVTYANGNESMPASVSVNSELSMQVIDGEPIVFPCDIYDVTGRLIYGNATSLSDLPKGTYIVNGKKIIVE